MTNAKPIKAFPFPAYFWAVVSLAVIGLVDALYLSTSHYRVYTDIGYKSFCAISRAVNCDTISQSPYSIFLSLPVPVWGGIGYSFFVLLLVFAGSKKAKKERIWALLFWISLGFSCYSVILALISTYLIQSYCIMCIVAYGVNLSLLYYCWIIRKRFSRFSLVKNTREDVLFLWKNKAKSIPLFSMFLIGMGFIWIFYPSYWNFKAPPISANIPTGITASGHPWMGAEKPVLDIIEFTDYQCFQCKKMNFFLRQLVAENSDRIRIIHRNYPMDHKFNPIVKEPFHVGSGKLALIAVYAAAQNKFWKINDLLFSIVGKEEFINVKELAETLGLDYNEFAQSLIDRKARYQLQHDIWTGNKLGITGTPAYVIDGEVYFGQIPADIIKKGMQQ